jgi:hypothetical protein
MALASVVENNNKTNIPLNMVLLQGITTVFYILAI